MNTAIFREYDIRGVADRDYDEEFVRRLGRAFATHARGRGAKRVSVGRDCRLTSEKYHGALCEGIRAAGVDVVDVGMCPTPLLYFSLFHLDLDGGVQVTGSHNPPEYNGFKLCIGKTTIHGEEIQELRRIIERGEFAAGNGAQAPFAVIPAYQAYLRKQFEGKGRGVKVATDSGNGTAGFVAPEIFRSMGAEVVELYSGPDGRFPNHHPDPTIEENMKDLRSVVTERGLDLGIAFDGDADRIGIVDHRGKILWGDEMLVLFARYVLATNPGATIVSEVKCSQRLYDDIAKRGGKAIMWKAGHSLLKAKMRETGAALGGEMSGHMFFADRYFGYDDAIYAGCRMVELLAQAGKPLADLLSDLPVAYNTPEIRVDCPDELKFKVAERAKEVFRRSYDIVDIDGVRMKFPEGWGLIRASNTQPVLVLRFEASSREKLAEYRSIVEKTLSEIRQEIGA